MEGAQAPEEALVSCPVCLLELPAASINAHLDRCLQQEEGTDDPTPERWGSSSSPEATAMGLPMKQPCNKKMRLSKSPERSHKEEEPGSSSPSLAPVFSLFHKGRNSGGEKSGAPYDAAASPARGKGEEKQLDGETLAAGVNASVPELRGATLAQKLEGKPLADKLRPNYLGDYMGQTQVLGEHTLLRSLLEAHEIPSVILWGPPGCGKMLTRLLMPLLPRWMDSGHGGTGDRVAAGLWALHLAGEFSADHALAPPPAWVASAPDWGRGTGRGLWINSSAVAMAGGLGL
ncbi:ATPase WRNIP1, partial [Varanus komodoensis]